MGASADTHALEGCTLFARKVRDMLVLSVNGKTHELDIEPETPMLWVLRDELGLTGTKFGCGVAQCGFCTISLSTARRRGLVNFPPATQSVKKIVTIEAIG